MDRLILEVRLTPLEAYWHLQRVLEQVNAISSSLITSETFKLNEDEKYADSWEKVMQTFVSQGFWDQRAFRMGNATNSSL